MSQKYIASKPDVKNAGLTVSQEDAVQAENQIIKLDGLDLSVKPFNARLVQWKSRFLFIPVPFEFARVFPNAERFGKNDKSAAPPFVIEVAVHPLVADLSIDPSQFALHLAGNVYKPTRMIFLTEFSRPKSFGGRPSQGLQFCFWRHKDPFQEKLQPVEPIRLSQHNMACVWLSFDIAPPPPETEYSLTLNGIVLGRRQVQIPNIKFEEGYSYVYDYIP